MHDLEYNMKYYERQDPADRKHKKNINKLKSSNVGVY